MLHKKEAEDTVAVCLHTLRSTDIYEDTELAISVFNLLTKASLAVCEETKQKIKGRLERIIVVCESMGTRFVGDTVILKGLCVELLAELNKKTEQPRQLIYF